jgi:hypothetical protein
MAEAQTQSPPRSQPQAPSLKFKDMNPKQKTVFVLKVAVCILSGGMVFPNVMHD